MGQEKHRRDAKYGVKELLTGISGEMVIFSSGVPVSWR